MDLPLPPGWVAELDPRYNRTFYFHKQSKTSTWKRPKEDGSPIPADDFKPAKQRLLAAKRDVESGGSTALALRDSESQLSSSDSAKRRAPAIQTIGKFDHWLEMYSLDHKRSFYFNKITRESVWVDPRVALMLAAVPAATAMPPRVSVLHPSVEAWEPLLSATAAGSKPEPISPNFDEEAARMKAEHIAAKHKQAQQQQQQLATPPTKEQVPVLPALVVVIPPAPVVVIPPAPQPAPLPAMRVHASMHRQDSDYTLENELQGFSTALKQERDMISKQAGTLDAADQARFAKINGETDDLLRSAEQMANMRTTKTPILRQISSSSSVPTALANWGVDPPKVVEVRRAMRDVEQGVKYAREELKAHAAAAKEAALVDAEGGYYNMLGIPPDAPNDVIKKAFRKAMIKTHPDKVPVEEKTKAQMLAGLLQDAFDCLTDPWERFCYDYFGLKSYLKNQKVVHAFKAYLRSGIELVKHPRKGFTRSRMFWISPDYEWIMSGPQHILEPDADEMLEIKATRISDIFEISRGITTQVLERTGKKKRQSRYFSIVTSERTLDWEAESKERCDFLYSRLSLLVMDTQKNKKWLQRFFEIKAAREAAEAAAAMNSPTGLKTSPQTRSFRGLAKGMSFRADPGAKPGSKHTGGEV